MKKTKLLLACLLIAISTGSVSATHYVAGAYEAGRLFHSSRGPDWYLLGTGEVVNLPGGSGPVTIVYGRICPLGLYFNHYIESCTFEGCSCSFFSRP